MFDMSIKIMSIGVGMYIEISELTTRQQYNTNIPS